MIVAAVRGLGEFEAANGAFRLRSAERGAGTPRMWNGECAIATEIIAQEGRFAGPVEVYEVNGPDSKAMKDFGREPVKTVRKPDIAASSQSLQYSFPPHSLTLPKGTIKR